MGCIIVPSPIVEESEIATFENWKGLKCFVNILKSLNGSSEINNAFPSGHATYLLISTIVAADCNALS